MKVDMIPRRESRFTLVELMIVVAIISIIAAVAIPSLLVQKKRIDAAKVAKEFEGKHVTAKGFDEVGLVTNVEDDQLTVYFPNIGEVKFKRGMVKIVKGNK